MSFLRLAGLIGLLLAAGAAQAGTISPALQTEMDRTSPDVMLSVIVIMADQAPIAAMNEQMRIEKVSRAQRHARVIGSLQLAAGSQRELIEHLDDRMISGEVHGYTSYWIANLLVVSATKGEIVEIAARPDVDWVEPNFTVSLIEPIGPGIPQSEADEAAAGLRGIGITPGLYAINAPQVWFELGYTGAGRIVANLDTGVAGTHPAYATRWRGYNGQHPWQHCWLDVLGGNTQFPTDTHGHGTHVMGTQCGAGHATGDTVGVAWNAQWIACNAINQGVGGEFDNDVITAYQWFADPDGNPETVDDVPDVVQNSWRINEGFPGGYTDCDTRWWAVIDNCEAAGCVTTWSAGNEGPGSETIGSPPDRATTTTNAYSVGAVDATNYGWPYPIASFSSRGPSGCDGVPPANLIKPEVVAPGVQVYSSVVGGGYSGSWSGTSMAGPHVAGVVGLMREANPDLDVDSIKQIMMDTARDLGAAGEDNTYGWGIVDAYAAVIAATVGFGQISGSVTNASWADTPIQGVQIQLVGLGNRFYTDEDGEYQGSAPAGLHLVEASHPAFRPDTALVEIISNELVVVDFSLEDITGPFISDLTDPKATSDTDGPYTIAATVTDPSTVAQVTLFYRFNGGGWIEAEMLPIVDDLDRYSADIPGRPAGTRIDFYVQAEDGIGLTSTDPSGAPDEFLSLFITEFFYAYDAEYEDDWQLGAAGDDATTGIWIRADPIGTTWNGQPVQPEDDHTPDPGVECFVTGNGSVGGGAGENDVDHGCTTLLSRVFDLGEAEMAFITYHRWFGQTGNAVDDEFAVDVSNDGGSTWYPLERVPGNENYWQRVTFDISAIVPLSDQIRFRFVACDLGQQGLVEAAIDDVSIETFIPSAASAGETALIQRSFLAQNQPNPFNPVTMIRYSLATPADARLVIYDAGGRLVRTLLEGKQTAGVHQVAWDGRDDSGDPVGSGIYFYRLKAGAFEQSRRMTILK